MRDKTYSRRTDHQDIIDRHKAGETQTAIAGSLGVSRQRVNQIIHPAAHSARAKTAYAIKNGYLPPPTSFICAKCSKPATEYDHRDYANHLDVIPMCRLCNVRNGRGENGGGELILQKRAPWKQEQDSLVAITYEGQEAMCVINKIEIKSDRINQIARKLGIVHSYLVSILNRRKRPGARLALEICKEIPGLYPYLLRPDIFEPPETE